MTLLIIATGGTIDKTYASGGGTRDLSNGDTQIPAMLAQARVHTGDVIPLLAKDSLDMTDEDRALIAATCAAADAARIVITHGTDTMSLTAAVLAAHPGVGGKTIVLTGAAQPWCLRGSDADFALGFAAGVARCASAGVWIAMNGQAHPHDRCRKNLATGVFEPV